LVLKEVINILREIRKKEEKENLMFDERN